MKSKENFLAPLLLTTALSLAAPLAQAAVFDVTLSADILAGDFVINDADGAVFGVTPTDTTLTVNLQVDTAAGVDSAAAGDPTQVAGTNYTFGHDVWGYSASVLSATFGSKTWDDSDIVTLDFGDGIDNALLFLDAELGSGTPTLASFRLSDDGFAFFGQRACGGPSCSILQGLQINDFNGGGLDSALNDFVTASNYDISAVSAVPVPAAFWLFGTALAGLIGLRKKAQTT